MSKIKINHFENVTISYIKSVELDTEILSKCEPSFNGETFDELMDFLHDVEMEEFTEDSKEILGKKIADQLYNMYNLNEKIVVYDSSNKFCDDSFEDGEEDLYAFEIGLRDE